MTILGTVDIRDFDLGCFVTLGSRLVTYLIDGEYRGQYVVDVAGINTQLSNFQNSVPVYFEEGEDTHVDYILPSFVFKKTSFVPAFERHPVAGTLARAPAKDAEPVIVDGRIIGYTRYDEQVRADPYDMSYDLTINARRMQENVMMVKHVMEKMRPPWFNLKVIDSLGDVREYDAGEVSYSNSSELADIADRVAAWTFSFTVRADIDTYDDICSPSMTDPRVFLRQGVEREV